MFSNRFHWDLRPNRVSELAAAKRRAGIPILDLTGYNPTTAGLPYPAERILASLDDPRSLVYDPVPAGSAQAREAVAAYYAARGMAVDPGRILLTSSTSEAYAWLFKLLADPGDEVLVPRPSYPLFEFLAAMESVRVAQYPLVYHGAWSLDEHALERAIGPRTRAVVIVNPNNPTGSFLKQEEFGRLAALCRANGLAIISDEVFADYALDPGERAVSSLACCDEVPVFSMSGLSKVSGLPQMKLGWIVVAGPASLRRESIEKLELIADTYLSPGTPVQHAAAALLETGTEVRREIMKRLSANLAFLQTAVATRPAFRVLRLEGGWCATLQVPRTMNEEEWILALLEHDHVLVQPGYFYDFESEAFLILSLLTPPDVFREGIARLLARNLG